MSSFRARVVVHDKDRLMKLRTIMMALEGVNGVLGRFNVSTLQQRQVPIKKKYLVAAAAALAKTYKMSNPAERAEAAAVYKPGWFTVAIPSEDDYGRSSSNAIILSSTHQGPLTLWMSRDVRSGRPIWVSSTGDEFDTHATEDMAALSRLILPYDHARVRMCLNTNKPILKALFKNRPDTASERKVVDSELEALPLGNPYTVRDGVLEPHLDRILQRFHRLGVTDFAYVGRAPTKAGFRYVFESPGCSIKSFPDNKKVRDVNATVADQRRSQHQARSAMSSDHGATEYKGTRYDLARADAAASATSLISGAQSAAMRNVSMMQMTARARSAAAAAAAAAADLGDEFKERKTMVVSDEVSTPTPSFVETDQEEEDDNDPEDPTLSLNHYDAPSHDEQMRRRQTLEQALGELGLDL